MNSIKKWDATLAEYRRLRMDSALMPLGVEGEDEAIDAYCDALDRLIAIPAPSFEALALKFELATIRSGQDALFDAYAAAILADIRRLSGLSDRPSFDPADWIERATVAGLAFFARGQKLWVGAVNGTCPGDLVERFKRELDPGRSSAIVEVLTARGLQQAEVEA